ncbi:MAG: tetratricopeptide repeat protein [Flavisolibacter sp.]
MKKSAIVVFLGAILSIGAMAQSVQEGINYYYNERFGSAKATFEKILAGNPNNLDATYWLGQTMILNDEVDAARTLYQKALAANGNAPILMVGMGHVDLLDGKKDEARQLFETAITASKKRKKNDPDILNAIGRANVQANTDKNPNGDLAYAISKLNEAAELAPNNPDIFLNLGNAYRKLHNGSESILAYRKAGNFAPALYRTALLYRTQANWEVVLENLNSAVTADPKFAPAYLLLYDYYLNQKRDFATAEKYANDYRSNADASVENDYLLAQTYYVQEKYADAIKVGKNIVSQAPNAKPRVYRLLAYSYLASKDTAGACENASKFLAKADDEELLGNDYILHATACAKGDPTVIRTDVMKAVQMDSVLTRQINMINQMVEQARAGGQKILEGELRLISYELRGKQADPNELVSYIAVPFYLGGAYEKADSVAQVYIKQMPDSIHGYYWSALALSALDPEMEQGLAIPAYEKVLSIAESDKGRLAAQGAKAAITLAIYYNNVKKDRTAALTYVDRGLALDPSNENLLSIQKALNPSAQRTGTPQKSGSTAGSKSK